MKAIFLYVILLLPSLYAYEMGRGVEVDEKLQVGGYFSTDYTFSENKSLFRLGDVALLGYGNLSDEFSYFVEFEAAPFYYHDFETNSEKLDAKLHAERLYIDYRFSALSVRLGKQISPIGYWNFVPINVLRDTSSNPKLSSEMFPKFLTGVSLHGYFLDSDSLSYTLFGQKTEDLDDEYMNIKNEHFFGLSIKNEQSYELEYGASLGEFIELSKDRVYFAQINAKYDFEPFTTQFEAAINHRKVDLDGSVKYKYAAYLQTLYRFTPQHMVVGRYEYFRDDLLETQEHIGVLGYSYRPIYPVSLKFEYQFNSQNNLNKSIISFSVLF